MVVDPVGVDLIYIFLTNIRQVFNPDLGGISKMIGAPIVGIEITSCARLSDHGEDLDAARLGYSPFDISRDECHYIPRKRPPSC